MNDLPEELLIEVLLRLPVKSLLRFKVACKAWRSYISDRKFVKRHVMRTTINPSNDYFIACNDSRLDYDKLCAININSLDRAICLEPPIDSSLSGDTFRVVGSCNGLLCLDYKRGIRRRHNRSGTTNIYLWNPATRKVKDLPRCSISISITDYDEYQVSLGFGFDLASSDYKVLRIVRKKQDSVNRVEVYSLKNNSWREIVVELSYEVCNFVYAASVKGSLYWNITKRELLLFNMQTENFCTISLPPNTSCRTRDVFEFKEYLAFANVDHRSKIITIWTLDDDNSCWIQKLTITNPLIITTNLVGYMKTGELVGHISPDQLVLYDSTSDAIKSIQPKMHTYRTYDYNESLVYLN